MAKIAGKVANYAIVGTALEDEITSITQNLTQESIVVTALDDTGPRRVAGNYDFNQSIDGVADFASGQGDATIFARLGGSAFISTFDPTGATAGVNDPNYDSSVILASYNITAAVGAAVTYSAQFDGAAALVRNTS